MSEVNYGRIALIPQGDFNGSKQYDQGDVVTYKGTSYLCRTRPPLGTLPVETEYFQVSARGATDKAAMNQTLTIPFTGWIPAAVGQYSYSISLPVSGITAQDIPSGSITIDTEHIAQGCNLAAQCQSGERTITFYAETVPEAEMTYEYYILKGE